MAIKTLATFVLVVFMLALPHAAGAAGIYELTYYNLETDALEDWPNLPEQRTDTPAGIRLKISDMSEYGVNDVETLKLRMPKGYTVNSEADIGYNEVIGTAFADTIGLGCGDAYGKVRFLGYKGDEPGNMLRAKATLSAKCSVFFIPFTIDADPIYMDMGLDGDFRVTTRSELPASVTDIDSFFSFMYVKINKPLIKTPHECGSYTSKVSFYLESEGEWDSEEESHKISENCYKKYLHPFPKVGKLFVFPDDAAESPWLDVVVSRDEKDHNPLDGFTMRLPQGWVGNIFATDEKCSAWLASMDACPEASRVADLHFSAQVYESLLPVSATAKVYLSSEPGDDSKIARLYIISKLPPVVGGPDGVEKTLVINADVKLVNSTPASMAEADYSIEISSTGIPHEFDIRHIALYVDGRIGLTEKKPLLTLPTQCGQGFFNIRLIGYDESMGKGEETVPFKPVGCNASYPHYDPQLEIEPKSKKPGNSEGLKLSYSQGYGTTPQATTKKASIILPQGFVPVSTKDIAASNGEIADVTVTSPLSDVPFTGKLRLDTASMAESLSQLKPLKGRIDLSGKVNGATVKVPLDLEMTLTEDYRIKTKLLDAPQLPVSKMEIDVQAGVLKAGDICKVAQVEGYFTSHNASNLQQDPVKKVDTIVTDGSGAECYKTMAAPGAPTIQSLNLSSDKALSHPESFKMAVARSASDHGQFKKLTITMPKGFVASPAATGGVYCDFMLTQFGKKCSDETLIGTGKAHVQVFAGAPEAAIPFEIHMATPPMGAQGQALVLLDKSDLTDGHYFAFPVDIEASKKSGYRIQMTTDGLSTGLDIRKVELDLKGKKGASSGNELLTLQPHCDAAQLSVALGGLKVEGQKIIDSADSAGGYGFFKASGCPVKFDPEIKHWFSPATAYSTPDYTVEMSQEKDEGQIRSTTVVLDKKVKLNSLADVGKCQLESAGEWPPDKCGDVGRIGTVEVKPHYLLPGQKIYGTVNLLSGGQQGGPGQPVDPNKPLKAGIFLDGFIEAGLNMTMEMTKQDGGFQIKAKVDNPDLSWPLESFKMTLDKKLLKTTKCGDYGSLAMAQSHGGESHLLAAKTSIEQGCDNAPALPGPEPSLAVNTYEPRKKASDPATSKVLKEAGSHPDLTMTIGRCIGDDPIKVQPETDCKNPSGTDHVPVGEIDASFPAGFVGSPLPTAANASELGPKACTEAQAESGSCPASSQVGKVKAWIQAMSSLAMFSAQGSVNIGLPPDGKVARIYYVLKLPQAAGSKPGQPAFLSIPFDLGFGPETGYLVKGSGEVPVDFDIRWMQVELFGDLESYARPFLRLPTQCQWGKFTVDLYGEDGSKGKATKDFQAKGCESQIYKPISAIAFDPPKAFANTKLALVAYFAYGSADSKEVEYLLPSGFTINDSIDLNYCKEEDAAQFNCPPQTTAADVVAKTPLLLPSASDSAKKYGPVYGKAYFVEQPKVDDPMKMAVLLDNGLIKARLDTELKMVKVGGEYRVRARVENPLQAPVSLLTLFMSEKVIRTPVVPSSCPAQFDADASYTPYAWELTKVTSAQVNPNISLAQSVGVSLTQGCGVPGPSGGAGGASFDEAGQATPEEEDCTPTDDAPQCGFNPSHEVISSDKRAGKTPQSFKIKVTKPAHNFNLASFNLWLPRGFAGNVTATPKCNLQDAQAAAAKKLDEACDQATKVGDVWVTARKTKNELITEKGSLYNAEAAPGRPGRLITYVKLPAILDNETVLIASDVEVKGKAERIYTTVDMPDELESMVNIVGMEIELKGDTNSSGTGPFLMNQTDSNWAELYSEYSGQWGWAKSFSHPYVATEADKLDFAPSLDVTSSNSKPGAGTTVATDITLPFGQAAMKRMEVAVELPIDLNKVPAMCTQAQAQDWACPNSSKIADIEAGSWLLPSPLTGTLNFGQGGKAYVFLSGFIPLFMEGSVKIDAKSSGSTLIFDDMPPMPVTSIKAEGITLFKNPTTCKPVGIELKGLSHSGRSHTAKRTLGLCQKSVGTAKLSVKLKPNRAKAKPRLSASFTLADAQKIRSFELGLGKGKRSLRASTKGLKAVAGAGSRPLGKIVFKLFGGKSVTAKVMARGKKLSLRSKKLKKARVKLAKRRVRITGIPANLSVKQVKVMLNGRKGTLLTNPTKRGTVLFTGLAKTYSGEKVSATKAVKVRR